MTYGEKVYAGICWIPLAGFGAATLYARSYQGGGSWGAAGLVILPILLSVVLLAVGVAMWSTAKRQGRPALPMALSTLLAGSVFAVMGILFMLR